MRIRILISGRVQGVSFRFFVEQKARALDLSGFVRNTEDGSVEVVAEGPKEKLDLLAADCRKGPAYAKIENVEVSYDEEKGRFDGFGVL